MSRRLALLTALLALGAAPAEVRALEVVTVRVPSNIEIKPGVSARIALQVTVKPGYHVQANPVENPSLIPITLKVDAAQGISVGQPLYPPAKRLRLSGASEDLVVYDGTFAIAVPLSAGHEAAAGATVGLTATLRYQACDDSHCLFPVTLPVAIGVTVAPR